jgi:hypothetical protein
MSVTLSITGMTDIYFELANLYENSRFQEILITNR